MNIIYTRHAGQRMKQRGIAQEQVEETISGPDEYWIGTHGEEVAVRHFGTHSVRVVYEATGDESVLVITVIRLRR